ncbi:MAG: hypothetical protein AAGJ35_10660, partial [Myxococcota bacterium]
AWVRLSKQVWPLFWRTLPLGAVSMLVSLNVNAPRLLLKRLHGAKPLGGFGPLSYLPALGQMFLLALGQTFSPRLAGHYQRGELRPFLRLLLIYQGLTTLLWAVGFVFVWMFGPLLLSVLFQESYMKNHDIFLILWGFSVFLFWGGAFGFGCGATRQFQTFLWPVALQAVLTTGLSAWLIWHGSQRGAAWASACSYVLHFVAQGGLFFYIIRRDLSAGRLCWTHEGVG